ncbi:MAG: IS21 family transposase [Anaerolineae bacterium]
MSNRRLDTMDLHQLLRRLRANEKDRRIAKAMQLDRRTVAKYREWAQTQQLLDGELPDLAALHALAQATLGPTTPPPQNQSPLEPYTEQIRTLLEQGLGPYLVYQKLCEHPGFTGSRTAVWRLTRKLRPPKAPKVVLRLETPPGEVAQVDFGEVTPLIDPQTGAPRRTYAFVMVLAWSRHMYVEFVFDQKIPTWLVCHQHAFEFFGGVPQRVVLDNLKAAIIKAYRVEQEAEVVRAYAECAEHYDFLIDPCLPAKPQHKGKVERGGVGYLKQSFMPLVAPNTLLAEAQRHVQQWLMTTAGLREHGTIHEAPLARFARAERAALRPLPTHPYDPAVWKQVKLHRDGHVVFEKAFYSAPSAYVGQRLWLRAGLREIRLFSEQFELLTTHRRATQPGERLTKLNHFPAAQVAYLTSTRATCQARAEAVGPATAQVVAELLAARPLDKTRTAIRLLKLAETYTPARLEAACARGWAFGDVHYVTLKHILEQGLDALVLPPLLTPSRASLQFARPAAELAATILGGATWN